MRALVLLLLALTTLALACGDDSSSSTPTPTFTSRTAVTPTPSKAPTTAEPATEPTAEAHAEAQPLTMEERAELEAHRRLLAEGRRLERAGQHAEAIASFEGALRAMPGDPQTLGELGWAELHAGDLGRAETITKEALAGTSQPRRRATLLYNLGRVLEARGQREEAAALYRKSIDLRPNHTVEQRLASLGAVHAPALDVFDPACVGEECGSVGPFPTLDALTASNDAFVATDEMMRTAPPEESDDGSLAIAAVDLEQGWVTNTHLALRTARGWFWWKMSIGARAESRIFAAYVEDPRVTFAQIVPGGPSEALVEIEGGTADANGCCGMVGSGTRALYVCGVDGDTPTCWAVTVLEETDYRADNLLPTPAESLGECDDFADTSECAAAEAGASPLTLTITAEGGALTIAGFPSGDPRNGAHGAAELLCGLPHHPVALTCAE